MYLFFEKYASKFYQKRFRDKDGITKYFVKCFGYHLNEDDTITYEFELYVETGLCCIKTKLFAFTLDNLDLVKIEDKIEEIYQGIGDKLKEVE